VANSHPTIPAPTMSILLGNVLREDIWSEFIILPRSIFNRGCSLGIEPVAITKLSA